MAKLYAHAATLYDCIKSGGVSVLLPFCTLFALRVRCFVSVCTYVCSFMVLCRASSAVAVSLVFVMCRASSAVCCQPLSVRSVSGFVSSMLSVLVFVLCYAVSLSSAWALLANTMLYKVYSLLSNSVHLILVPSVCMLNNVLSLLACALSPYSVQCWALSDM